MTQFPDEVKLKNYYLSQETGHSENSLAHFKLLNETQFHDL